MEGIWTFPSKLSRAGRVGIQNLLACISGFGDMEDCWWQVILKIFSVSSYALVCWLDSCHLCCLSILSAPGVLNSSLR